jgi:hypothetical protein
MRLAMTSLTVDSTQAVEMGVGDQLIGKSGLGVDYFVSDWFHCLQLNVETPTELFIRRAKAKEPVRTALTGSFWFY